MPSSFDFNTDGGDEAKLRSSVLESTKESSVYYTRGKWEHIAAVGDSWTAWTWPPPGWLTLNLAISIVGTSRTWIGLQSILDRYGNFR